MALITGHNNCALAPVGFKNIIIRNVSLMGVTAPPSRHPENPRMIKSESSKKRLRGSKPGVRTGLF